RLDLQIEQLQQPPDGGRVELAQRLLAAVAHLAEDRSADVHGAASLAPLHDRAAPFVGGANHPARDAHHQMHADAGRCGTDDRALEGREIRDGPFRGVLARAPRDEAIGLPFLTQKAEHRRQRRQPDASVAQTGRVQPRFVEFEARRQEIRDSLMEARNKEPTDAGFNHAQCLITYARNLPSVPRMILPLHDRLRVHVARLLTALYSLDESSLPAIALEYPPNRDLGDLGTPVAFELARRLRKAPRAIAQEIAGAFGSLEGIRQVAAAPNGYLNFFLERRDFLLGRLSGDTTTAARPSAGKAIVEHTAINPNKAAHIGHLRNSALGDTLVRVLRFRGIP